jgi:uncharacterized protein
VAELVMPTSAGAGALVDPDVMVPMRDGVLLAADVYRPAGEGRHPALLYRTPYSKSNLSTLALTASPPCDPAASLTAA